MPMCQSPRIAEVLLRANTTAVNDNVPAKAHRAKSRVPEDAHKAMWSTLLLAGHRIFRRARLHLATGRLVPQRRAKFRPDRSHTA